MNTPHDDEMPKDLERVHAALNAPTTLAPEELLERILTSRAAGEWTVLPTGGVAPSRFRTRMMRWTIAAAIGLLLLAKLKTGNAPPSQPKGTPQSFAAGFGGLLDLGFVGPALAQQPTGGSSSEPVFAPLELGPHRVHPFRGRYVWTILTNRRVDNVDTLTLSLGSVAGGWVSVLERVISPNSWSPGKLTDSLWLSPETLQALHEQYTVNTSNEADTARIKFGDSTATLYAVHHVPGIKPGFQTRTITMDSTVPIPRSLGPRSVSGIGLSELIPWLMAAPLADGWRGSFVISRPLGIRVTQNVVMKTIPVDLEVVGSRVVNGEPCWVVERQGELKATYLVRKRDRLLISMSTRQQWDGKVSGGELRRID